MPLCTRDLDSVIGVEVSLARFNSQVRDKASYIYHKTAMAFRLSTNAMTTGPFRIESNGCSHDIAQASVTIMGRP
jgi:hypothetical protein